VLGIAALEVKLSGPLGISGYVVYRAVRSTIRDALTPDPPTMVGFSNTGPNAVIIVLDCYRYDYLDSAPILRSFGERAWVFDRYYSAAPWTKPSTVSLFTGLSVRKHFVLRGGGSKLPTEALTLAELMQAQGFSTAGFVWNPHLTRRQTFDQGFDFYVDNARRGSKTLLSEFFWWLDRSRPERFFAYIHFQGTHDPYYLDNDLGALLSAPPYPGGLDFTNTDYKQAVNHEGRRLSPAEAAHLKHVAEGKARRVDREAVGGFLERFEASGLPDNTLLVITSDHGDGFAEHEAVSHGSTVYNEEVHVPLLMRFPERFARERSFPVTGRDTCPASTVDLLPTLLDFVGAAAPPGIDGVSIIPDRRSAASCSRPVVSERTSEAGHVSGAAMVVDDRKVIVDYEGAGSQLFDLSADPSEARDLSGERAGERRDLEAELARRLNADGSSMAPWSEVPGELTPEMQEELRALGYVDAP
jgi:arylsulfatase A-like enzyme